MAPAAAGAASIPSSTVFAGGSLPLSLLMALVACLLTASSVVEPARQLSAADSAEVTAPVPYAGPIAGALMLAGVVVLVMLSRRHPERMAETARAVSTSTRPLPPAFARTELHNHE
ncbi:hypothetical protein [Streptomyces sp. 2A115]|uniref:hypothetical protein n=1 Tax=Streptomyces sp. 2A115 TaxID=3457439 RepID=UPI003FCF3FBA